LLLTNISAKVALCILVKSLTITIRICKKIHI